MRLGPSFAVVSALALAACSAGIGLDSPHAQAVRATDDPFLPYQEYVGAEMRRTEGSTIRSLRLVGRRDRKTGVLTTHAQIMLAYKSQTAHHFDQARSEKAELLAMRKLDGAGGSCQKAGGCPHNEAYIVDLPEADLRSARETGYKIKLFGRNGADAYFPIPAQLVDALYQKLGVPKSASPAPSAGTPTALIR